MDPQRWLQARNAFEEALELPTADREELLSRLAVQDPDLRQEVEALLGWHGRAGGFLEEPAPGLPSGGPPPLQVGPYRVRELLGEGGMGQVYLATRADDAFRKTVAVKILAAGLHRGDLVARFRAERQILAQLDHPNIARLLDGGATADGRPYLVMEAVDGLPLDRYCAEKGLDVPARLRLFLKVCAAVRFAHQNLVVHRDLKPGNILVTADGEPKLLDFGIAKLLGPGSLDLTVLPTASGLAPMTPRYASPEQVLERPVTVLSDVYALGVLLYELLTGRHPYLGESARLDEVVRAICETAPALPSSVAPPGWRRRLAGDLDNILLKALRKEPERRYASAGELARDLESHLAGLPVAARPDTFVYRAGKFVRRHRLATATAAAFLLFLTGFLAVLLAQRRELLDRQRQLVEQRNRAEAASEFMAGVFSTPDPTRSLGETVTARELLNEGAARVDRDLAAHPEARADLLLSMGRSYKNLGLYAEARKLMERSLAERRRLGAGTSEEAAAALHELAEVAFLEGRLGRAEILARQALALRRRLHGEDDRRVVESRVRLARILEQRGEWRAAGLEYEQALVQARPGPSKEALARLLDRYAILKSQRGEDRDAEAMFREALVLERQALGERHPEPALTRNNLALLLVKTGRFGEAETLLAEAERIQRGVLGDSHPYLATTLNNRGFLLAAQGRAGEAERFYQGSLAIAQRAYRGGDHPRIASTLHNLGDLEMARGDAGKAEALYRRALAMRRRTLPPGHPETAATLNNLGRSLAARGDRDGAESAFREALARSRQAGGENHPQVAVVLNNLADLRQGRGDLAGAEKLYLQAIAIWRHLGLRSPDLAAALSNLGSLQRERGDLEASRKSFGEGLALMEELLGPDHLRTAMVRLGLADLEARAGRPRRAEALARHALRVLAAGLPPDDAWVATARRTLDVSLEAQGEQKPSSRH